MSAACARLIAILALFLLVATPYTLAASAKPSPTAQPECWLKPDPGTCRGFFRRYFYNPLSKSCEVFVHGGCDGCIPFRTNQQCEAAHCELMADALARYNMQFKAPIDPSMRIFAQEARTEIL